MLDGTWIITECVAWYLDNYWTCCMVPVAQLSS